MKENYSKLVWQKPKITGGLSDFYQLRVLEVENSIDIIENIYIIGGSLNECLLQDFSCSFEQHSFDRVEFNVRSVNIDPEYNQTRMSVHLDVGSCFMNKVQSSKIAGHYYGEWSQPIIFWCHLSYSHFLIWIILLLSLLLAVLLYLFYLFYNKYKQMKDIEVELPKGLTDMPYPEEDIETMEIKGLMKFDLIQEIEESISGFDTLQIEKSIVSDRVT